MDKFKGMVIGIVILVPLFLIAGYKWGEHVTANEFISISGISNAGDTRIYTKMGVLIYNKEYDRLAKYISAMAHASYVSMYQHNQLFGQPIDTEVNEYFNSNKSKLVPVAP